MAPPGHHNNDDDDTVIDAPDSPESEEAGAGGIGGSGAPPPAGATTTLATTTTGGASTTTTTTTSRKRRRRTTTTTTTEPWDKPNKKPACATKKKPVMRTRKQWVTCAKKTSSANLANDTAGASITKPNHLNVFTLRKAEIASVVDDPAQRDAVFLFIGRAFNPKAYVRARKVKFAPFPADEVDRIARKAKQDHAGAMAEFTKLSNEQLIKTVEESLEPNHFAKVDVPDVCATSTSMSGSKLCVPVDDVLNLAGELKNQPAYFEVFPHEERSKFPHVMALEDNIAMGQSEKINLDGWIASVKPNDLRHALGMAARTTGVVAVAALAAITVMGNAVLAQTIFAKSGGQAASNAKDAVLENAFLVGEVSGAFILLEKSWRAAAKTWCVDHVEGFPACVDVSPSSRLFVDGGPYYLPMSLFEDMCAELGIATAVVMRVGGKLGNAEATLEKLFKVAQNGRVIMDVGMRVAEFDEVSGLDEDGASVTTTRVKTSVFAVKAPKETMLHRNIRFDTHPQFGVLGDGAGNVQGSVRPQNATGALRHGVNFYFAQNKTAFINAAFPGGGHITLHKCVVYAELKRLMQGVRGCELFEHAHQNSTRLVDFLHALVSREKHLLQHLARLAGNRLECTLVVDCGNSENASVKAARYAVLHAVRVLSCAFDFLERTPVRHSEIVAQYIMYRRLLETKMPALFDAPEPNKNTDAHTRAHADILRFLGAKGGMWNKLKAWVSPIWKDPETGESMLVFDHLLPPAEEEEEDDAFTGPIPTGLLPGMLPTENPAFAGPLPVGLFSDSDPFPAEEDHGSDGGGADEFAEFAGPIPNELFAGSDQLPPSVADLEFAGPVPDWLYATAPSLATAEPATERRPGRTRRPSRRARGED